jgi:hypothetical protein
LKLEEMRYHHRCGGDAAASIDAVSIAGTRCANHLENNVALGSIVRLGGSERPDFAGRARSNAGDDALGDVKRG